MKYLDVFKELIVLALQIIIMEVYAQKIIDQFVKL